MLIRFTRASKFREGVIIRVSSPRPSPFKNEHKPLANLRMIKAFYMVSPGQPISS
jgi:hypothetical protein